MFLFLGAKFRNNRKLHYHKIFILAVWSDGMYDYEIS